MKSKGPLTSPPLAPPELCNPKVLPGGTPNSLEVSNIYVIPPKRWGPPFGFLPDHITDQNHVRDPSAGFGLEFRAELWIKKHIKLEFGKI